MIDHLHGHHITGSPDTEYPTHITRSTIGFHVYDSQAHALPWNQNPIPRP